MTLSDASITALTNLIYFGAGLAAGLAAARVLIWVECATTGTPVPHLTHLWWMAVAIAFTMTVPALVILTLLGASDA